MHSHYKYKQMSWEKNDEEKKKCQIFASVMYSSYQAGVSPEGGLEVGQTLWFFLEALCAQTNLFWSEMKIDNMYTEI